MAVRVTTLGEFRRLIRASNSAVIKGHSIALIETGQDARKFAIENAKRQFKGDPKIGRRLTGQLLKSIKVVFEVSKAQLPKAFLSVEGIPYGAIHEFGGTIKPRRAKNLWVKVDYKTPYKRLTPREFMSMRGKRVGAGGAGAGVKTWSLFKTPKGATIAAEVRSFKSVPARVRPLFVLKKQVNIPERPYLRPAADKAGKALAPRSVKRIAEQLRLRRRR